MEQFPFMILFFGVAISSIAVTLGIGGGILWSPVLILLFGIRPAEAITSALAIQIGGMGVGALSYYRAGNVDIKAALLYALLAMPMVVLGSVVSKSLPEYVLKLGLGVMAVGLALFFLSGEDWYMEDERREIGTGRAVRVGYIPFLFSFVSGLLSIGIGDIMVPALVKKLGYSMKRAVGTSLVVMFIVVVAGLIAHLSLGGGVSIAAVTWGLPGVVIGSYFGSQLSRRVKGDTLREAFIFVMVFIGIHILYTTI